MANDLLATLSGINLGLSVGIVFALGYLTILLRKQGKDLVLARVFLKWKSAVLSTLLLELGIVALLASNVLGFQAAASDLLTPWGEMAETVALLFILAGWLWFAVFLRLPRTARGIARDAAGRTKP